MRDRDRGRHGGALHGCCSCFCLLDCQCLCIVLFLFVHKWMMLLLALIYSLEVVINYDENKIAKIDSPPPSTPISNRNLTWTIQIFDWTARDWTAMVQSKRSVKYLFGPPRTLSVYDVLAEIQKHNITS